MVPLSTGLLEDFHRIGDQVELRWGELSGEYDEFLERGHPGKELKVVRRVTSDIKFAKCQALEMFERSKGGVSKVERFQRNESDEGEGGNDF